MGVVVGAVAALLVIVFGFSPRVRAETGMDDEVETRLLLGLEPEPAAEQVPERPAAPSGPSELAPGDLRDLEEL